MERLNNWFYNKSITLEHSLSIKNKDCLIKMSELTKREGAKKDMYDNEKVIDLDCVERDIAKKEKRSKNNTIDCTFAIQKHKSKERKMLLVEFKLNAVNGKNIDRKNIVKKDRYSRNILGNEVAINDFNILIYNERYINEATNTLRRLFQNKAKFIAVSNQQLASSIFKLK